MNDLCAIGKIPLTPKECAGAANLRVSGVASNNFGIQTSAGEMAKTKNGNGEGRRKGPCSELS